MEATEHVFWMTNRPTIAEVRQLNKDAAYSMPLAVLSALIDQGHDLDKIGSARVRRFIHIGSDLVQLIWQVYEHESQKEIGIFLECDYRHGEQVPVYLVPAKRVAKADQ